MWYVNTTTHTYAMLKLQNMEPESLPHADITGGWICVRKIPKSDFFLFPPKQPVDLNMHEIEVSPRQESTKYALNSFSCLFCSVFLYVDFIEAFKMAQAGIDQKHILFSFLFYLASREVHSIFGLKFTRGVK